MRKIAILTAGKKAKKTYEKVKDISCVTCYVDNDIKKWNTYDGDIEIVSIQESVRRWERGEIDRFLMPGNQSDEIKTALLAQMTQLKVDKNVILCSDLYCDDGEYMKPFDDVWGLPYMEFSVVEQCNLNCSSCMHFAPLAPHKEYAIGQFEKDIKQVRRYIDYIDVIRIMGGEPLLNTNLEEYIRLTRQYYPDADIRIVSNGMLIPQMSESLCEMIRRTDTEMEISIYPPLVSKMEEYFSILRKKDIKVKYAGFITKFAKVIDLEKKENPFGQGKDVYRCGCVNLYDGKMSVCPVVMFINRFNDAFDTNLSQDGLIDIYDLNMSKSILKEKLSKSVPLCENCRAYAFNPWDGKNWESMNGRKPQIEDWLYQK